MIKKSYYLSKDKNKNEIVYFEYDKMDGYNIRPKVNSKDAIKVDKIIFVNSELSEKIIRKKIDKKIEYLLEQLKNIEEDNGGDMDSIKRSLLDAEKLRVQIINNYVKYLGHTYSGLTMKKIQIIIEQLRYKLYTLRELEREIYYNNEREGRRGR